MSHCLRGTVPTVFIARVDLLRSTVLYRCFSDLFSQCLPPVIVLCSQCSPSASIYCLCGSHRHETVWICGFDRAEGAVLYHMTYLERYSYSVRHLSAVSLLQWCQHHPTAKPHNVNRIQKKNTLAAFPPVRAIRSYQYIDKMHERAVFSHFFHATNNKVLY